MREIQWPGQGEVTRADLHSGSVKKKAVNIQMSSKLYGIRAGMGMNLSNLKVFWLPAAGNYHF